MTTLAVLTLVTGGWDTPTPVTAVKNTKATYYGEGLMEIVRRNRGIDLLPGEVCVAVNRAADVGRTVWFRYKGFTYRGRACDCAQKAHYKQREKRGLGLEVPYWLARTWGMRGPVPVRLWYAPPPGWIEGPRPL